MKYWSDASDYYLLSKLCGGGQDKQCNHADLQKFEDWGSSYDSSPFWVDQIALTSGRMMEDEQDPLFDDFKVQLYFLLGKNSFMSYSMCH